MNVIAKNMGRIPMPPTKSLNLLIDQFIETDIRAWIEEKEREPEQEEIDFDE